MQAVWDSRRAGSPISNQTDITSVRDTMKARAHPKIWDADLRPYGRTARCAGAAKPAVAMNFAQRKTKGSRGKAGHAK
jgi:hypothetical protein